MNNSKKPLSNRKTAYWFHAKNFGWGWGMPAKKEGWLTYAGYVLFVVVFESWLANSRPESIFEAALGLLLPTVALVWLCVLKGEPTKWRITKKSRS